MQTYRNVDPLAPILRLWSSLFKNRLLPAVSLPPSTNVPALVFSSVTANSDLVWTSDYIYQISFRVKIVTREGIIHTPSPFFTAETWIVKCFREALESSMKKSTAEGLIAWSSSRNFYSPSLTTGGFWVLPKRYVLLGQSQIFLSDKVQLATPFRKTARTGLPTLELRAFAF